MAGGGDSTDNNSHDLSTQTFIEEGPLRAVIITFLVIGVGMAFPTAYIRWKNNRLREVECLFLLSALLFFIAYESLLLEVMPIIYQLFRFSKGEVAVWPTIVTDLSKFTGLMFTSSLMSWTLLWSVKLSLLFLYRRLMMGLPHHMVWWKVVFGYTIVTYLYTMVTTFTSCGGPINITREPFLFCAREGDNLTRNLSFYGAFASDLSSDLLIMILPIRLIWGLQMSLQRKLAVGGVFSIGAFVMIAAIVRLVQIDSQTGSLNPNSQWLALWGSVEATTAVIVGYLPTFRFLRKSSQVTKAQSYSLSSNGWPATHRTAQSIALHSYTPSHNNSRHGLGATAYAGHERSSSSESLAPKNAVLVTTRHEVESQRYR